MKQSQAQMLHYVDMVSFAVIEANLFLDTHPDDEEALAYFRHYSKLRNKALKEYAEAYGPLTIDTANMNNCETWEWVKDPWPWQAGGEC